MRCQPRLLPNSKIMLVGEAPGEQEELTGVPFIGESGQELYRMLNNAGINGSECSVTNVFLDRPANNDLQNFCISGDKRVWDKLLATVPGPFGGPHWPLAGNKRYFDPALYVAEIERLYAEVDQVRPTVVVALGATALWALTKQTKITKLRGTISCMADRPYKVLPTYHPSAVLRAWDLRVTCVADFEKAARESAFPEIRRPRRELWLEPTTDDLLKFESMYLSRGCSRLSVDIETAFGQITCIGFSPHPSIGICIPLVDHTKPDGSFYSLQDELAIWAVIRRWLSSPLQKVFQNGLYDIQYLWRYGCDVLNFSADTMLCHHALYSELPKDLGYLGSIYTDEPAWKAMKPRGDKGLKKED